MVAVGGIVSVGGGGGGSGGGSTSGITSINGAAGPAISFIGVSGIDILRQGNTIFVGGADLTQSGVLGVNGIDVAQVGGNFVVDGASLSGLIIPSGGIGGINGQIGPHVEIKGVNGVEVSVSAENCLLIDGAGASGVSVAASGLCHSANFVGVTSTTISHNLGTTNVVVSIYDASENQIIADLVNIVDANNVTLQFNRPQTGKAVIVACGGNDTNLCEAKQYALLMS